MGLLDRVKWHKGSRIMLSTMSSVTMSTMVCETETCVHQVTVVTWLLQVLLAAFRQLCYP